MGEESENTENNFKDANEVEDTDNEEMVTKKKPTTKKKKSKASKTPAKKSKTKRTVKSPEGSGTVTRSAVAKAAKKITSKRSDKKKKR